MGEFDKVIRLMMAPIMKPEVYRSLFIVDERTAPSGWHEQFGILYLGDVNRHKRYVELVTSFEGEDIFTRGITYEEKRKAAIVLARATFWMAFLIAEYVYPFDTGEKMFAPLSVEFYPEGIKRGFMANKKGHKEDAKTDHDKEQHTEFSNTILSDTERKLLQAIIDEDITIDPLRITLRTPDGSTFLYSGSEIASDLLPGMDEKLDEARQLISEYIERRMKLYRAKAKLRLKDSSLAKELLSHFTGQKYYERVRDSVYAILRDVFTNVSGLNRNVNVQLALVGMHAGAYHYMRYRISGDIANRWVLFRDYQGGSNGDMKEDAEQTILTHVRKAKKIRIGYSKSYSWEELQAEIKAERQLEKDIDELEKSEE